MKPKTVAISIPQELLDEIDQVSKGWFANRSATFIRIYQEWKQWHPQAQLQLQAVADQSPRRVQDLPNFIPNPPLKRPTDPDSTAAPPPSKPLTYHLGTGPGDEANGGHKKAQ